MIRMIKVGDVVQVMEGAHLGYYGYVKSIDDNGVTKVLVPFEEDGDEVATVSVEHLRLVRSTSC